MSKDNRDLLVGLDIGTSKVVALIENFFLGVFIESVNLLFDVKGIILVTYGKRREPSEPYHSVS